MANQIDGGTQTEGAVSGIDQEILTQQEKERRKSGRDDRRDDEIERKRLEPGQDAEGAGGAGAAIGTPSDGNSNT